MTKTQHPKLLCVGAVLAGLGAVVASRAGTIKIDFNTDPSLIGLYQEVGTASAEWRQDGGATGAIGDGYLSITDARASQRSVLVFKDLEPGLVLKAFTFECDLRIGGGTARPADGFSMNYVRASDPIVNDGWPFAGTSNETNLPEEGSLTGLGIGFDTWQSGDIVAGSVIDCVGISVRVDGNLIGQLPVPLQPGNVYTGAGTGVIDDAPYRNLAKTEANYAKSMQTGALSSHDLNGDGVVDANDADTPQPPYGDPIWGRWIENLKWEPFVAELTENSKVKITWKGVELTPSGGLPTTFSPSPGRLVFGGRTGGAWEVTHIDNIVINTITNGDGPTQLPATLQGTVVASPASALADGKSAVTVTVTLHDGTGKPLAGKTIKVSALGMTVGVSITQPANPTDANGQATATLTLLTAGTVLLAATDVTDGIPLSQQAQQPLVTFTANLVPPSAEFSSAISAALDEAMGLFTQSDDGIAHIAKDEGEIGAYFSRKVSSEAAQACVDVLFFAGGEAADAVLPKLKTLQQIVVAAGESVDNDLVNAVMKSLIEGLASDASGLTKVGEGIATVCNLKSAALASQAQSLRNGIPAASADRAADLITALTLRSQANQVLWQVLQSQDAILNQMRAAAEAGDGGVGAIIGYGSTVVALFLPPPANLMVGLAALNVSLLQRYQTQKEAIQGYQTAWSSLTACSQLGISVYENIAGAFLDIAQGRAPDPVTGTVLAVHDTGLWTLQKNSLSNPLWSGTAESTPAYLVTASSASTVVEVKNTGTKSATFEAFAFYHPAATTLNASASAQVVVTAVKSLGPGEQGQLELVYYDGHNGAVPDGSQPIQIAVLGWNRTGAFYAGSGTSAIQFTLTPPGARVSMGQRNVAPADEPNPANTLVIQNPIQSFMAPNATNQSYDALIEVRNPFLLPLLTRVNQAIPTGVTVLATDGMASGSDITWTNWVPANGVTTANFSFRLSTTPGAATNLPAPTVVFSEAGTTNDLELNSIAPVFNGVFPVQVAGSVPLGTPGTNATMLVTVTNLTTFAQSGTFTLTLTNAALVLGTNLAQQFVVTATNGTNLNFSFPGDVPPGQYAVAGLLSMNGGSGQVLAGVYTMPTLPFSLSLGPAPVWSTSGLSLALQGPVGSNYLIQASADLANWTPIRYFGITNSPFYFNDASTTNSGTRFYRAVMP